MKEVKYSFCLLWHSMEKKCLYTTSILCIEGPTEWFPDQPQSWEVDWVIFLIGFCPLISLSWFFFFLITYYNDALLSTKKSPTPHIEKKSCLSFGIWWLAQLLLELVSLLSSGHRGAFPAHPGLCTHRHAPACAAKGEREPLNQSAGEIRNWPNFGVRGVNSKLWTCPAGKSCCSSCVVRFHEHWLS